ncbi:MAG: hypothetical protein ACK5GT_06345 [Aphanizomenon sp.]|jgi:predicted phage tail protein
MARIQIADINPSESELLYELNDGEILDINGGSWFSRIVGAAMIVVGCFTTPIGIGIALIEAGAVIIAAGE